MLGMRTAYIGRGSTMSENLDLLHRSLEAWNRQDLATYAELYAPDAVIRGLGPGPLGVEGMLGVYQAFFAGFPCTSPSRRRSRRVSAWPYASRL
jgi:hypothetical protein